MNDLVLPSEEQLRKKAPPSPSLSALSSLSPGKITIPIDVLVKFAIMDGNPSITEGSLTPSTYFVSDLGLAALDLYELRRAVEIFFQIRIDDNK